MKSWPSAGLRGRFVPSMYSNKLYTPLRYPGGKARFAPFIASVMQFNGLDGGHYMEPYAGGAGVALELLFDGVVTDIHINDADPAVYAFWFAATAYPDALISMVETEPINMDAWMHWRGVMHGKMAATDLERGFATLFMNRTNRSGILKGESSAESNRLVHTGWMPASSEMSLLNACVALPIRRKVFMSTVEQRLEPSAARQRADAIEVTGVPRSPVLREGQWPLPKLLSPR